MNEEGEGRLRFWRRQLVGGAIGIWDIGLGFRIYRDIKVEGGRDLGVLIDAFLGDRRRGECPDRSMQETPKDHRVQRSAVAWNIIVP